MSNIPRLRLIIHTKRLLSQLERLTLPILIVWYGFILVAMLCGIL